jgi:hypothetical protein
MPETYRHRRFLRCEDWSDRGKVVSHGCGEVFWWDGPSLLPKEDPHRKRTFSDALVPVDPDTIDRVLKRT